MNSPSQDTNPTAGKSSILKPFGYGVLGMIVGFLILFVVAWFTGDQESLSASVMGSITLWPIAFLLGLLSLIIAGFGDKRSLASAVLAYLLPVVVLSAAAILCIAIYPVSSFAEEIIGFLPVAGLFYLFGFIWMRVRSSAADSRGEWLRAVMPPLFGGLMILAFVAVPTFTSNAFLYRNAFALEVVDVEYSDRALVATCILEVRKPGHYKFTAPSYFILEPMLLEGEETGSESLIVWGTNGEPSEGAGGTYPLEIQWEGLTDFSGEFPFMESVVYLEARSAESPETLISTIVGKPQAAEDTGGF